MAQASAELPFMNEAASHNYHIIQRYFLGQARNICTRKKQSEWENPLHAELARTILSRHLAIPLYGYRLHRVSSHLYCRHPHTSKPRHMAHALSLARVAHISRRFLRSQTYLNPRLLASLLHRKAQLQNLSSFSAYLFYLSGRAGSASMLAPLARRSGGRTPARPSSG